MKQSLTRLTLSLFLLTSIVFSTGCVPRPAPPVDTSWVKPIYFHEKTLTWLEATPNWPDSAYDDFDAIRKHNEKYEQIMGVHRPATQPTTRP
jgi:hypothetical protein